MWLKVPFPGLGNDVTLEMPVTIDSGMDHAIPRIMPVRRSSTFSSLMSKPTSPEPRANDDVLGLPSSVLSIAMDVCGMTNLFDRAYWDVNSYDWGSIDYNE